MRQEEVFFEVEDIKNEINDDFKSDVREIFLDEYVLELVSDDKKDLFRSIFDG